jgi:hypothetical protein
MSQFDNFIQLRTLKQRLTTKVDRLLHAHQLLPEKISVHVVDIDSQIIEIKIIFSRKWYKVSAKFPSILPQGTQLQEGVNIVDNAAFANGEIRLLINQYDTTEGKILRAVDSILMWIEPNEVNS